MPTYNNADELTKCLNGLLRQSCPLTRVLVAVDGSTDKTTALLQAISAELNQRVTVLAHPKGENRGRATTRNLAMREVNADFVWLVDSDMDPNVDALDHHLRVARTGVVSVGRVNDVNASTSRWASYLNARGRHRHAHGVDLPFSQFTTANSVLATADASALVGFGMRASPAMAAKTSSTLCA